MSLTLSTQPGFTELPDADFAAGAPASDAVFKALNAAAKFAAVRNEQFWGYYKDGETVVLPVSPVDGYAYSRAELIYSWSRWYSGPSVSALNGTQSTPGVGGGSGAGYVVGWGESVDQATGLVNCHAEYYKTSQTNTSDGILMVITHAQRNR